MLTRAHRLLPGNSKWCRSSRARLQRFGPAIVLRRVMLWRGTSQRALSLGGPFFVSTLVLRLLFLLEYTAIAKVAATLIVFGASALRQCAGWSNGRRTACA